MTAPKKPTTTLTNDFGVPVADNQNSLTAGERGPVLLQDHHLLEKLAHFNRERVPERVVHAKGSGAFGTFRVTRAIPELTCAKLFSRVGNECRMLARFSTVAGEQGFADTVRDPRGFALKFYTEDGNWDLVGNNTPCFLSVMALSSPISFILKNATPPLVAALTPCNLTSGFTKKKPSIRCCIFSAIEEFLSATAI